jgi:hypothetical protein
MVKDRRSQNNISGPFAKVHTCLMQKGPGSSFVGRAAELALLEAALDTAVGGSPRVVFVGGEAGIGRPGW